VSNQVPAHNCHQCGHQTAPVFNGRLYLRGWLCTRCERWEPAIGRERKFHKTAGRNP